MRQIHVALAWIRNTVSSLLARGPAFWAVTLLIALLVPSPVAAPVLYARFRHAPPRRLTSGTP